MIAILILACFSVQDSSAEGELGESGEKVVAIEIRGHNRIEPSTIRARLKTKEGDLFSSESVREDIRGIYQLGFFLDVRVESEAAEGGVKVIYEVTERPTVTEITFLGNLAILPDKLKDRIMLKKQTFLDDHLVKEDVERLRQMYEEEGFSNTEIIPVLKMSGNQVTVIFSIKEGAKATVKKITFDGGDSFSPGGLNKNIETRTYSVLTSWFTNAGYYKKAVLNDDTEKLKDFYLNNGYLQVQVGTPLAQFKEDRSRTRVTFPILHGEIDYPYDFFGVRASVTFPIIEGDQFFLRSITFRGNEIFTVEQLREVFKLKEEDLFRRNLLRQSIGEIQDMYGERGYLYAMIIPQYSVDPATRKVDLVVEVTEDNPMRVRRISIGGNEKTRDKVIRREIRVNEQELVNTTLLRRSFQRVNNLNFFESVDIAPERVGPEEVDLQIRVKEKSTGSLSVGGGYSSVDRVVGLAEITQGNLFGRGQLLRARVEVGKRRNTYSLTFREPYLLDYPVSGTVNLFNQRRDFNSYKERRVGGSIILGKSFTEYVSGSLSYTRETLTVFDLSSSAPARIQSQAGQSVTSSMGATVARDTRDFIFDPKEGSRVALSGEYAGTFLGGDNDFVKGILDLSRYFSLPLDLVLSLHGRLGYATGIAGSELPIGERFFVGGINTVRGFNFGRAGPVDPLTNEIVGGNKELITNTELLIPLVPEAKIKGVLFFDAGKAFDDNERIRTDELRLGGGFGLRWVSPIGPLRLEWGYNLNRREGERASNLEFTIGTLF